MKLSVEELKQIFKENLFAIQPSEKLIDNDTSEIQQ